MAGWVTSSFCSGGQCAEVQFVRSSACTSGACAEVAFVSSSACAAGECVEVGFAKSSACTTGSCVEVGAHGGSVLLRDGKLGDASPVLEISPEAWRNFLEFAPTV